MSNPAIEREDLGAVAEGAQQGIVDVEVDGSTRDGGVYVKYQTHAVPAIDDVHEVSRAEVFNHMPSYAKREVACATPKDGWRRMHPLPVPVCRRPPSDPLPAPNCLLAHVHMLQ